MLSADEKESAGFGVKIGKKKHKRMIKMIDNLVETEMLTLHCGTGVGSSVLVTDRSHEVF